MLIFICDDSKADQLRLARNINNYAMELHASVTVQVFDSADAMLKDYKSRKDKPDIIFLDIYMDGTNGMDAAHALVDLGMENGLVFTTSSEEHALQAFSVGADGYLHKPFTREDFNRTMRRFKPLFEDTRRYVTAQFNRTETRIFSAAYTMRNPPGTPRCSSPKTVLCAPQHPLAATFRISTARRNSSSAAEAT